MSESEQENLLENMDFEAKHNLASFFDLLLKIDKRNNPKLYQYNNYADNRNTNNPN